MTVFDGIEVAAIIGQALNIATGKQLDGALWGAPEHRLISLLLAEHHTTAETDHAVRLGQAGFHRLKAAIGAVTENSPLTTLQVLAEQEAAFAIQSDGADVLDIVEQHLIAPAGFGHRRVQVPPAHVAERRQQHHHQHLRQPQPAAFAVRFEAMQHAGVSRQRLVE